MTKKLEKGFRHHFNEADELNKIRKIYYAAQTNGKSKKVSNIIIYFGKSLYPIAYYFDKKAVKFNNSGINIIKDDFVSLRNVAPVSNSPKYANILNYKDLVYIFKILKKLRKSARKSLKNYNYSDVCELIADSIIDICNFEKSKNVHIALVKHILESIGFAVQNAIIYNSVEDIKLKKLSRLFIHTQLLGTILSPLIDREANKIHKLGYGIILNDIPDIPFQNTRLEEYRKITHGIK